MDGDQPAGGKWNYDHDNRKPAPDAVDLSAGRCSSNPMPSPPRCSIWSRRALPTISAQLRPFWFATDRGQALERAGPLDREAACRGSATIRTRCSTISRFLYHALIALYLNAGLLDPLEVCQRVEAAWKAGEAPLNAVEGFIRQIIGWREYVRGIYFREGPDYTRRNVLEPQRTTCPIFYWGAPTPTCAAWHAP